MVSRLKRSRKKISNDKGVGKSIGSNPIVTSIIYKQITAEELIN